jgi:cardiolipin synthase
MPSVNYGQTAQYHKATPNACLSVASLVPAPPEASTGKKLLTAVLVNMPDPQATSSVRLLVEPNGTDCAGPTFDAVLEHFTKVQESVEIHMFVWRSDAIGNEVAQALLDAADRGVRFRIKKDTSAIMYERIEMNRKSLFNKAIPWYLTLYHRLVRPTFPDTYVEDARDASMGDRIMAHANGTMEWPSHTHTKYYIFDEKVMLTGSINVEDRHRGYFDYMVALEDPALVARFRERQTGAVPVDPSRSVEFVANRRDADGNEAFEIKPLIIDLMNEAKESIYVEMAYLGDPEVTEALMKAAHRGIQVTLFVSRHANIGNDLNYAVMHEIMAKSPTKIVLSDTMIHAKLFLFDDQIACFGSANASIFSMQKAVELNLLIQNEPTFLDDLRGLIDRRLATGHEVKDVSELKNYRGWLANLQQFHQKMC